MVYNTLDYKIQANTLELENDLTKIEANVCDLYNQIASVGAAAGAAQKEMEELVKAISEVSSMTCHSASEVGDAFRSLMYKIQDKEANIYYRIGDIEQALRNDYATRTETNDIIDNLESKMPFQIFDSDFEFEGIPMKMMANPDYPDRLYIMPANPEKPIKLVFENESLDDWYKKFVESLKL
jgi:hypothetical protein